MMQMTPTETTGDALDNAVFKVANTIPQSPPPQAETPPESGLNSGTGHIPPLTKPAVGGVRLADAAMVQAMRKDRLDGMKLAAIRRKYGLSQGTVHRILYGVGIYAKM